MKGVKASLSRGRSVKGGRVRERLVVALRERIVSGRLGAGEKLNERVLSLALKASRTPLREALLRLEREGLVRSDLRRGFTVEPLSAKEVRETYPILARLECLAVEGSAELLPVLVPKLTKINREFARSRSAVQALDLDTLWHDTLMGRSTNRRLMEMVATLRRAIRRYELIYMGDADLTGISVAQHEDIIAAIRSKDLRATLAAIELNYVFGMKSLLCKMEQDAS